MATNISLFQGSEIRKIFHSEEWWFSIADVVSALTDSADPTQYIKKMRKRDPELDVNWGTVCTPLLLPAPDGKMRETNCANMEGCFRIIQSIPSPKAEPFKLWLAKTGYERIQEIADPERSLNRARENWQKYGRSEQWIQQRMMGQETRNKLTDYWSTHEVKKGQEFAILTNLIHQEWAEVSVKEHKAIKGLNAQNLRDHPPSPSGIFVYFARLRWAGMNEAELIFTALAEMSTRQIAEGMEATGLEKNKIPAKKGGQIAKDARRALEAKTGKQVVSPDNFLPQNSVNRRIG
ncbi:MAG: Bro-N domain-containing protein [Candidatus Peribacteraceae bacterium]|nr:Bro-N domain-containing protein [Candidatus Peribacteraceae bacterium]